MPLLLILFFALLPAKHHAQHLGAYRNTIPLYKRETVTFRANKRFTWDWKSDTPYGDQRTGSYSRRGDSLFFTFDPDTARCQVRILSHRSNSLVADSILLHIQLFVAGADTNRHHPGVLYAQPNPMQQFALVPASDSLSPPEFFPLQGCCHLRWPVSPGSLTLWLQDPLTPLCTFSGQESQEIQLSLTEACFALHPPRQSGMAAKVVRSGFFRLVLQPAGAKSPEVYRRRWR